MNPYGPVSSGSGALAGQAGRDLVEPRVELADAELASEPATAT